ncbi:MAG: hypothetical protein ACR2QC_05725 [Gammaproteobacteria bacterium]
MSVLFAAAFGTTAANAQEADRAQVYTAATDTFTVSGRAVDLRETLVDIIADVAGNPVNDAALQAVVSRIRDGGVMSVDPTLQNGLPTFGGTVVARGDVLTFIDPGVGGGEFTVRVYENADMSLAVADGDGPVVLAATVDTAADEFFLTNDWEYTTNATLGTRGFDPAETASAADDNGGGNPGGDNDSNARDLAVIGLGVGVVGFMAAYLSGGDFSLFNFNPDFGYSLTESGYSVNAVGRLNFRKDRWHLYYAAGQENANGEFGDFRYESGGEYTADLWTAAFSETVQGETADYDFSLSADYGGGIWKVSPTYRLHSHFAEADSETDNALNLEGVLRYNRWTIRPSAGFRWESAEEFGDNARFNLSAVRRF